ncbi:MAG: hypothetical protein ACR2H3_10415 [Acidimicrobiales bacterium]
MLVATLAVTLANRGGEPRRLVTAGSPGELLPPEDDVVEPPVEIAQVPDDNVPPPEDLNVIPPALQPDQPPAPKPAPTGPSLRIAADPKGRWTLELTAADCLDLVIADGTRHDRLLCAAPAAEKPVGLLVAIGTTAGRVSVMVVQPDVTGPSSSPRQSGGFFYDAEVAANPGRPGVAYMAGFIADGTTDIVVKAAPHTVAHLVVPGDNRLYPAVEQVTGPPYGRWNGYRKVTSTGYYFRGDQELGFYSGAGGQPCVLYRRLGGPAEAMLGDGCARAGDHFPYAVLSRIAASGGNNFTVLALTDVAGASAHIELLDGERVNTAIQAYSDTNATGWIALAERIHHVELPAGTTQVIFVLTKDGVEVARKQVAVPT